VGYLAVWLIVIGILNWVSRLDTAPGATPAMRRVGALSLVLLVPTATFAAFDWSMSLEPEWYSSIYGAIVIAGGVLAAHCVAILGLVAIPPLVLAERAVNAAQTNVESRQPAESSEPELQADVCNDLGNLLLAFLMVFGYFAFSQFLIIWSGNVPSEISWYLRRLSQGWPGLALLFVVLGGAAFFMLLSRDRKRVPKRLAIIASIVLVAYVAHSYWMVVPAFPESGFARHVASVAAILALAGGWTVAYCWLANRCLHRALPAYPEGDQRS
jgi:hypothetical protein